MASTRMSGTLLPDKDRSFGCARYKTSPFLPPDRDSPESTSSWSQRSQPVRPAEEQQYSRKRLRLSTRSAHIDSHTTSRFAHEAQSPSPLVNTNYRIAGGLDTPNALNSQQEEDAHEFDFEVDCRPSRYNSQVSRPTSDSYFPETPASGTDGRNKRRLSPPSPPMKGWGKAVWAVTGGFAGKVFNFCWSTTFNGFQAGGGSGYRFDAATPGIASSTWAKVDSKDDPFHNDYDRRGGRERTPVPGGFPDDGPEFIEDYMSKLTVNQEQNNNLTPTKNRREEAPVMSRYNSWVVVDGIKNNSGSRESSPVRKKSRASTANLSVPQPSPAPRHSSHSISRPRLTPRSSTGRSSASFASPRASPNTNPTTQRSSSSIPLSSSHQAKSVLQSPPTDRPHSSHANRASLTSHGRQSSLSASTPTKQSPEVRKFEQKIRKKEAKQDASMGRFNDRLQEMIREGQAALGSRVEVEMGDDAEEEDDLDEGFYEASNDKGGVVSWHEENTRNWSRS